MKGVRVLRGQTAEGSCAVCSEGRKRTWFALHAHAATVSQRLGCTLKLSVWYRNLGAGEVPKAAVRRGKYKILGGEWNVHWRPIQ